MRNYLVMILVMFLFTESQGQLRATTESGDVVLLKDDGKWEYLVDDSTSVVEYSCENVMKVTVDKVSGKSFRSMRGRVICSDDSENGLSFMMTKGSSSLILCIRAFGSGSCIGEDQKVNFLLEGDVRLTLKHDSDFNCKNKFLLYFGGVFGKRKELALFQSKLIKTVRVWTTDGYVEEDLSEDQARKLRKAFECI